MLTILRYAIGRYRGQIIGWGLSLAILGVVIIQVYDTLAAQQSQLENLLKGFPPELMVFFGDMNDYFSPKGYINTEFFSYMPLILGIYALLMGSSMIAGDEESGRLDLVMAYPVSRTGLFFGRVLAFMIATLAVLAITYIGFIIGMRGTALDISAGEMALPFLSLYSMLLLFAALALLLSMLLPSARMAAMVSGLLLVASYFITSLARIDENLKGVAKFSPMNYYQGGEAIGGMNWGWFGGIIGFAVLFTLLAWWRFERRDIRVGGEGGWRLPRLALGRRA